MDAGSLRVFRNDSFLLSLTNGIVLQNGTTAIHLNGTWWSTTAATDPSQCVSEHDIDYQGYDLSYVDNITDPDTCCSLCSKEPQCQFWTWTANTANSVDPPWAERCYLKTSNAGRTPYTGHVSGTPAGREQRLSRSGARGDSGTSPTLGIWRSWNISYVAGDVPLEVAFVFYPVVGLVVFETRVPLGASHVNLTVAVNSSSTPLTEFASSMQPATIFPALVPAPGCVHISTVTWAGRFAYAQLNRELDPCAALQQGGGSEGGPLVLHANGTAMVIGPMANFKSSILGRIAPSGAACGLAAGVQGYVQALPAGFAAAFAVTLSPLGITDAMFAWGNALQRAYNTTRIHDVTSTTLTYWTDNGAYYDFYAYEPDINSKGLVEDILVQLRQTFANGTYPGPPLPVHSFMLDAYWMYNVRPDCNCKVNDTAWPLPFPHGLPWLAQQLGAPLILYNGPQCVDTTYAGTWPLVNSLYFDVGWAHGALSLVSGDSSLAFYRSLFADPLLPMAAFTQDFLDFNYLLFPAWLEAAEGNERWLAGQAAAALERSLPVQYCMALPSDFLTSLQFPAVTNARASQDYGAGGDNWRIGETSLLLAAMGLRPSKDNFWTSSRATDRGRETSPALQAAVCTLSQGPVGFADALLHTDPAVLWPCMRADGVLVQAGRPATAIDGTLAQDAAWAGLDVRAASTATPGGSPLAQSETVAFSVLLAGVRAAAGAAQLTVDDLWPVAPQGFSYVAWMFGNAACASDGAKASTCIRSVPKSSSSPHGGEVGGVDMTTLPRMGTAGDLCALCARDLVTWELWTIVPAMGPVTLLGEPARYVGMSPQRVTLLTIVDGGLDLELAGAPLEHVDLAYVADGLVRIASVALDTAGRGSVQLRSQL